MTVKVSPAQLADLQEKLKSNIAGDVLIERYERALFATDASIYQIEPLGVVLPRTNDDVVCAIQLAAQYQVPLIPRGGGTSLSGQSIGAGLIIDFSKYMREILSIDPQQRTARVQAGVVLDQLNAAIAKHDLQFGPDVSTSSRACLGGMIGNNSAGSRSVRHGKTVDHVISLETVLADGSRATFAPTTAEQVQRLGSQNTALGRIYRDVPRIVAAHRQQIIDRFPRVMRRVNGYNLDELVAEFAPLVPSAPTATMVRGFEAERFPAAEFNMARLLVGSEGTLACVTEALIHLVPKPKHRGVVVLQFDSLASSVSRVAEILESGPSAVEMFDGLILRLAEKNLEYRTYLDFVEGQPDSMLIAEFSAETADEVRRAAEDLQRRMQRAPGITHTLLALDPAQCDHIWACRKAALPLLMAIPGDRKPIAFVEDSAVSIDRLPEFATRFREMLHRNGTDGAFYGHASVGCLHIRPLIDTAQRDDLDRLQRISEQAAELVAEFRGAMSGEHGDGLARSYLNERLFGSELYQAMKQVKGAFDPRNLMNPGKVVDGPSPIENLRYGVEHQRRELNTVMSFEREGGIARAAEMCNGSGLCRKTATGTMCPSFMVTRDEEHSTRGRANALRLVLSGKLPPEQLTSPRLYETFDLCLQCKGCKRECPSNVDVAKLKVEFLHKYHAAHGTPLGARVMGNVARLNRWGSRLAPVSNWLASLPGAGWMQEKLLGVDRRRPLPRFVRTDFRTWFHRRPKNASYPAARGPIVLLDDCLTSFCEPQVNQAAVAVLQAAGYEVHLAGLECCGRAMISKGLLDEAQALARANIAKLLPWAQGDVPIVGCEPSCLLTLVDEYLDLAPGDDARTVARQARLLDSHLVRENIGLPLAPRRQEVLLHGHCYQKALVGTQEARAALEQVEGLTVRVLDSGCCGMAGSFGYEHYEVSMQIANRVLLPAVMARPEALVVAPGFSCRHQVEHGAGRRPLHPVELLAEQLEAPK